jgi:hypothetical protein
METNKPQPAPVPKPYGNSASYTPATDRCPKPFVPSANVYSPPAKGA